MNIGKFMQYCTNCECATENIVTYVPRMSGIVQLQFQCKKCDRVERYLGEMI